MISEFVEKPQWKFVKLRTQWDGQMLQRGGINMGVTWSLTTRKEHTWRMFESKVLRKIPWHDSKKAVWGKNITLRGTSKLYFALITKYWGDQPENEVSDGGKQHSRRERNMYKILLGKPEVTTWEI